MSLKLVGYCFKPGALECWSVGVLEFGVLECWTFEVMGGWSFGILHVGVLELSS